MMLNNSWVIEVKANEDEKQGNNQQKYLGH